MTRTAEATEVKERPILFSAPMIKAILAGTKRQTRRIVKNPDCCPHGQPGDLLWVREAWATHDAGYQSLMPRELPCTARIIYKSDHPLLLNSNGQPLRWRSPIHMPRAYSRLTLRVTGVRVERVNEISEEDALAEGITGDDCHATGCSEVFTSREAFQVLWESLHGPNSWAASPWVWVISFERTNP